MDHLQTDFFHAIVGIVMTLQFFFILFNAKKIKDLRKQIKKLKNGKR